MEVLVRGIEPVQNSIRMSSDAKGLYGSDPSLLSPFVASLARKGVLKWAIALTVALGAMLEVIDTSIVNVALPDIRGNLGATLSEAGWVSTGYACANVVIIPLTAWLGYRFGRKRYFLFSLVGFTLGVRVVRHGREPHDAGRGAGVARSGRRRTAGQGAIHPL